MFIGIRFGYQVIQLSIRPDLASLEEPLPYVVVAEVVKILGFKA